MAAKSKKHHFFFFRHCVRSTLPDIDLGGSKYPNHLQEYVSAPLPNWGVPQFWCTESSIPLIENTGRWLIDSGFIEGDRIEFELISDAKHRDIDTAFSLAKGIKRAAYKKSLNISGLDVLSFSREVFDPFGEGVCERGYSREEADKVIMLRTNELPKPKQTLEDGLRLLQDIAGVGSVGSLRVDDGKQHSTPGLNMSRSKAAKLLKYFAEILFYSHAGGVYPPFAPKASASQIYQLFEWYAYGRSLKVVDGPESAVHGAILSRAMELVLSKGRFHDTNTQGTDEYDTRVSMWFGHDEDLNGFATAFGANWELVAPYLSGKGGALVPTPPMSGIHAIRDLDTNTVSLSFIYPVYSQLNQKYDVWRTNTSGILEQSPLLFRDAPAFTTIKGRRNIIQGNDKISSIDLLMGHILRTLGKFSSAVACYDSAKEMFRSVDPPLTSPDVAQVLEQDAFIASQNETEGVHLIMFMLVVFGCLAGFMSLIIRKRKRAIYPVMYRECSFEPLRDVSKMT